MIGYVARYPHLLRHLQPIIVELRSRGVEVAEGKGDITLTAARYDVQQVHGPTVLVEHGAGQTYLINGQPVDAGSTGKVSDIHSHVVLYVGPNRRACQIMREWLPNALLIVASPLVEWMRQQPRNPSTVVFATHWPSPLAASVPDAGTSWPESAYILKALKPDIAHCHPRMVGRFLRDLHHHQIDTLYVDVWDQIWPTARLLVVDNSSILWEAAAVGVDVAVIQPSHWTGRHGLRFGVEADPLIRVSEENATQIRDMTSFPKPAGSPYEQVEGSIRRVADAVQTFNGT